MTTNEEIIEQSRVRARQLLIEAGPDGLSGDALEEFEQCEARARMNAEHAERLDAIGGSLPAGILGALASRDDDGPGGVRRSAPAAGRAVGNLPALDFETTELEDLHARAMSHDMTGGALEVRAISAPGGTWGTEQSTAVIPHRFEPTRIAALIPAQSVASGTVQYYRQSDAADAAEAVDPGEQKPESTPGWAPVDVSVRKIAHWTEVSTEALSDYPNFESVIRGALLDGLLSEENRQMLVGSGGTSGTSAGSELLGLLNTPNIQTHAPASGDALFAILDAIEMLRTGSAFTEADGIVLHPTDWTGISSMTTTDGALIVSPSPTDATSRSLWGVPVHLSTGIAAGTALVANFGRGAVVFSREPARVIVDPFSQSTRNMVRFVCEERLALGVTVPAAFVKVTLPGGNE